MNHVQFAVSAELIACADMAYADGDPKTGHKLQRAAESVGAGYYLEAEDHLADALVRFPGGSAYVRLAAEAMTRLPTKGRT